MQFRLIGHLPDEIATWTGSAAELAVECNRLMPACGLTDEVGSANERLVRHYVQIGVLTPPEQKGRDAVFAARQIGEFLTARRLLSEGWPLAKISELLKTVTLMPDTAFPSLVPEAARTQTQAEKALQQIRSSRSQTGAKSKAKSPMADIQASARAETPASPAVPSRASELLFSETPLTGPLRAATEIAQWRSGLRDNLIALGNASGEPERQPLLRISLTPWCHVDIDAGHLGRLADSDPEVLGNALAHALRLERLRKGTKS
jgi:DNA-binding transcriptional MerR regulator